MGDVNLTWKRLQSFQNVLSSCEVGIFLLKLEIFQTHGMPQNIYTLYKGKACPFGDYLKQHKNKPTLLQGYNSRVIVHKTRR